VTSTEANCLQRAQRGDEEAYSELVATYQTPVYNLCYRMVGSPQEAEEAAQETFWRAYRNIQRFDSTRSFPTWLLSIAAHFCIDQQRRRRLPTIELDELLDFEDITADPSPTPEKIAVDNEDVETIQQFLAELNPSDRAVLILRYFYDMSEDEICKTLSISKSAVKSRLHRARQHMAGQMMAENNNNKVPERRNHVPQTI
jgi:RNA polymerase sigma-70 factor (ECF subfamily)